MAKNAIGEKGPKKIGPNETFFLQGLFPCKENNLTRIFEEIGTEGEEVFNSNIVIFGRAARKELMIAEGKLLERDKLLFPFSSCWQPANGKTKTY